MREGEVVALALTLTLEEEVKLVVAVVLAKDTPGDSNKWEWTSEHFELISE